MEDIDAKYMDDECPAKIRWSETYSSLKRKLFPARARCPPQDGQKKHTPHPG
ncbi:MAG: hypothetical protein WBY53_00720 [Acidobacteriaceae bacterium]